MVRTNPTNCFVFVSKKLKIVWWTIVRHSFLSYLIFHQTKKHIHNNKMTTVLTTVAPTLGTTPLPTAITPTTVPLSTTTADALLKLCLLWSVLNKPELQRFGDDPDFPEVPSPPLICNDYYLYNGRAPYSSYGGSGYTGNQNLTEIDEDEPRGNHSTRRVIHRMDHKYSSRSFAVIG